MTEYDCEITKEVANCLDNLFGGTGETTAPVFNDAQESPDETEALLSQKDSPLRELESIILSIDWEIDEHNMNRLIEQVEKLKLIYKDDKTTGLFLKLLGSIARYIKKNMANAHPDAVTLLGSVHLNLQKVALETDLPEIKKKRMLVTEAEKFKALKKQIVQIKTGHQQAEKTSQPGREKTKSENRSPLLEKSQGQQTSKEDFEAFAAALDEIRQIIKAEFRALRAELKMWREEQ